MKYVILIDSKKYKDDELEIKKVDFDSFNMDKSRVYMIENKPIVGEYIPLTPPEVFEMEKMRAYWLSSLRNKQ